MTAKTIALVIPLGLDTLGVSLALGIGGMSSRERLRLSLWFAAFEAAMPLVGLMLGAPLGHAIGSAADYFAAAIVAALGAYMLIADEPTRVQPGGRGLFAAVVLGLSVSLDELAIGFSAGLLRLAIVPMVIAIAVQAAAVTQIGVRVGARAGRATPEIAEKLAGVALLGLATILVIERLAG